MARAAIRAGLGLVAAAALTFGGCASQAQRHGQDRAAPSQDTHSIASVLTSTGYIAVPLRRTPSGLDMVRLRLNGAQGNFLLDTGASNSVIDSRALGTFGISPNDVRRTDTAFGAGGQVSFSTFAISGFQVGGQDFSLPSIGATDLSGVATAFRAEMGITLDGIIGQDVMIKFDAVIDVRNETLFLRRR